MYCGLAPSRVITGGVLSWVHAKALDARFPFPAASVNLAANTSMVFAPSPEGVNVAV